MRRCRLLSVFFVLVLFGKASAQTPAARPYVWQNVKIVAGGFITGIVFSSREEGLAYVRTDIGGAYRWDKPYAKWVPLTDWIGPANANLMGVESVAADPTDADKVYLALGTYSRGPAAIASSADRGKTFQLTPIPVAMGANENGRGMGERLAVDPSAPQVLYFGSRRDGLWTSRDGAKTWQRVDSFTMAAAPAATSRGIAGRGNGGSSAPGIPWIVFDPRPGQPAGQPTRTLFAGVASGAPATLYRSRDAGVTWQAVDGAPPAGMMPHHAALDAASHALYITCNNGPGPNDITSGALWKYAIDSATWTNITPPSTRPGGYSGIALDPHHPGTILVSTVDQWSLPDDLFRSTDDGKTWKRVAPTAQLDPALSPYLYWGQQAPRFGWWMAALAIDPFDSSHAVFGTGATIWGTHDLDSLDSPRGQTHWRVEADGIEETAVLALISPPDGPHLISGLGDIGGFTHLDLSVSPAAGMHSIPNFTNTTWLDFAQQNPEIIVRTGTASRGGATAAISQDAGTTWRPLTLPGAPGPTRGGNSGSYLVLSSNASTMLTTSAAGTLISRDKGATWIAATGLPATLRPIADRALPTTFYALDSSQSTIYTSHDSGLTFSSRASAGLPPAAAERGFGDASPRLTSSSLKAGDLFVVSGGTLYRSTDAGATFSAITHDFKINRFALGPSALATPERQEPTLFVSATLSNIPGLFRSDDLGKTWTRINDEQHQFGGPPSAMVADPRIRGRLYIGMNGRGVLYGDPATR